MESQIAVALLADGRRAVRRRRCAEVTRVRNACLRASSSSRPRDERVVLLTGDLGFTVRRAVRRALPGPFLQRRRRRAEHGRRGDRPGRGRLAPVRVLDRHVRLAARRTSSSATARCCTTCRSASSASAAASTTGTTASRHFALEDIALMRAQPGHDGRRAGRPRPGARRGRGHGAARRPGLSPARQGRRRPRQAFDGSFELGRANVVGDGHGRRDPRLRRDGRAGPAGDGAAEEQGLRGHRRVVPVPEPGAGRRPRRRCSAASRWP